MTLATKTTSADIRELSLTQVVRYRSTRDLGVATRTSIMDWYLADNKQMKHGDIQYSTAFIQCIREFVHNGLDAQRRHLPPHPDRRIELEMYADRIVVMDVGAPFDLSPMRDDPSILGPEFCFTRFNAGTNFSDVVGDGAARTGAGRNGYGAKGAVTLSRKTELVIGNDKEYVRYVFVPYIDGIRTIVREIDLPENRHKYMRGYNYTQVTWYPDLNNTSRAMMDREYLEAWPRAFFEDMDTIDLTSQQVAARLLLDCGIYLKSIRLSIEGFVNIETSVTLPQLAAFYFGKIDDGKYIDFQYAAHSGDTLCQYIFVDTPDDTQGYQVGFANGVICGGIHIDGALTYIAKLIARALPGITASYVRSYVSMIVIVDGKNPESAGQTKDKLLKISNTASVMIGKDPRRTDDQFLTRIENWRVYKKYMELKNREAAEAKAAAQALKRREHIVKLNSAGLRETVIDHAQVTGPASVLLVAEGDSASGYVSLLRQYSAPDLKKRLGILSLTGVPSNTSDGDVRRVRGSLADLLKVIGLPIAEAASTDDRLYAGLKYGSVVLVTDADEDGTHIALLVLELFAVYHPKLVERGFIKRLYTPVVRVYPANKRDNTILHRFINEHEYAEWVKQQAPSTLHSKYRIKYYKGLGSGSDPQAIDDLNTAIVATYTADKTWRESMTIIFDRKKADVRKTLIKHNAPNLVNFTLPLVASHVGSNVITKQPLKALAITDAMKTEYVSFCTATMRRHIPGILDGLKNVQRQILYTAATKMKDEMKLPAFAGLVMTETLYHHGDKGLADTTLNMTIQRPGANNLPWFISEASIGGRDKPPAAARYTTIDVPDYFYYLIDKELFQFIRRNTVDGKDVEYEYMPIIVPMVLINGVQGMSTGWSTDIPSHHPLEIITILKQMCDGVRVEPRILKPYFHKFRGNVELRQGELVIKRIVDTVHDVETDEVRPIIEEQKVPRGYVVTGSWELNGGVLKIHDLPPMYSSTDFKECVERMQKDGDPLRPIFLDRIINESTQDNVSFVVRLSSEGLAALNERPQDFLLRKNCSLSGFNFLTPEGSIMSFETAFAYIEYFFKFQLSQYDRLRMHILADCDKRIKVYRDRIQYIEAAIAGRFNGTDGKPISAMEFRMRVESLGLNYDIAKNITRSHETQEEIATVRNKINSLEAERAQYESLTPGAIYKARLIELEQIIAPMFPNYEQ